jgi:hypothetical protein
MRPAVLFFHATLLGVEVLVQYLEESTVFTRYSQICLNDDCLGQIVFIENVLQRDNNRVAA